MAFPDQAATPPTNQFKPPLENSQKILCQLQPAVYDAFIKILSALDMNTPISIQNSKIEQSINAGTAILTTDITNIVKDITMDVLNPKKYIRLFKSIKGNNDVFIIDDDSNKRFIITNGKIKVFLPKQIEAFKADTSTLPDLSNIDTIGNAIMIDKDTKTIISSLQQETEYIDLLIYENQLKGINIPDTAIFSFPAYINEKIDEITAELKLRSFSFLNVVGETYQLSIGKNNEVYWLSTIINTNIVDINVLEIINPVSDETLLI